MNWKRNSFLILSLCLLVSTSLFAQTRSNSPYSIYGIGLLNDYSNPISFAMGGVGIAFQDQASLNPTNPASFASLKEKSFIFDAGFVMNSSKLSAVGISENSSYATLNHLMFGFQFSDKWKTSFGIIPFSDVGYNINVFESSDAVDEINHLYEGDGGITKAYWTNAFKVFKNFSFGVEAGLLFGKIERNHFMLFNETEYIFHNKHIGSNKYSDFYLKYGAQYDIELKEDLKLTIGAIYTAKTKIRTDSLSVTQLIQTPFDGTAAIIQTMDEVSLRGETTIPMEIGFGFMFTKKDKWKLGVDFEKQFWSKYTALDNDGPYKNSTRIAIGAEYIPDRNNVFSYYKRIKYRVGFRYENTPLYLNGTQINEFGISFGMGLPLRRSLSTINIGIEIGQFGEASNDLIKESFMKFKMGISMFQRWFEQRKYY